jgi:hypothetical protein
LYSDPSSVVDVRRQMNSIRLTKHMHCPCLVWFDRKMCLPERPPL